MPPTSQKTDKYEKLIFLSREDCYVFIKSTETNTKSMYIKPDYTKFVQHFSTQRLATLKIFELV